MEVLRLAEVSKSFGEVKAVNSLSLRIDAGTMFGLLGPNGAGKTTTIRMIMQIIIQDSGQIFLFGEPNSQQLLDKVGYLPEERGLYKKMKVGDQLQFLGELKGIPAQEVRARTTRWLERFDMKDVVGMKVEELSKGNQQKIQFIATILHNPRLVILDEPFSGLDPVSVQIVKDVMLELKNMGSCVIFSTHMMDQVERLCDSICLIDRGISVLEGNLKAVKKRFGKNTVLLEYEGNTKFLEGLDFVAKYNDYGNYLEVLLADADKAQELARIALSAVKVNRFEIVEPSLNEIFIETVKRQ